MSQGWRQRDGWARWTPRRLRRWHGPRPPRRRQARRRIQPGGPGRRRCDSGQRAWDTVGEPRADLKRWPESDRDDRAEHHNRRPIHPRLPRLLRKILAAGSARLGDGQQEWSGAWPRVGYGPGASASSNPCPASPAVPPVLETPDVTGPVGVAGRHPGQLIDVAGLTMLRQVGAQAGLPNLLVDVRRGYPAVAVVAVVEVLVSSMQPAHRSIVFIRVGHVKIGADVRTSRRVDHHP